MDQLRKYTFTNGTAVADWLETLPADEQLVAMRTIRQMIQQHEPLNLLQVKIKMTATRREMHESLTDELSRASDELQASLKQSEPQSQPLPDPQQHPDRDVYSSPAPLRPTVDVPESKPREHKRMSNAWIYVIVAVIALLIGAFATNPTFSDHKVQMSETIQNAASQVLSEKMRSTEFGGMLGGMVGNVMGSMVGNMIVGNIIDAFLQNSLEYHNYLLFSTCTVKTDDGSRTVSFGIFNKVFTFDENDIRQAIFRISDDGEQEEYNDPFTLFF